MTLDNLYQKSVLYIFRKLISKSFFAKRLNLIDKRSTLYESIKNEEDICSRQLENFNAIWKYATREIAFYDWWKKTHRLPEFISSIDEIKNFPPLSKKDINDNRDLIFKQFNNYNTISTGGSTGEPTLFPVSSKDYLSIYADAYVARSWWGVKPLDFTVSLWGHSHLFGSGFRGKVNEYKRRVKDRMVNIIRLNAYDMRPDTIARYYRIIKKKRPIVISGYSSCLYKLARYMVDHGLQNTLGEQLKVVLPTSESVSGNDISIMELAFGCPAAIEYGMAETGIIAHSRNKTGNLPIFWDSFFCRVDHQNTLYVTTTNKRLFPLINYRTDDRVTPSKMINESVLALKKIEGRAKESFTLETKTGTPLIISGILVVHVMKGYPHIYSVQGEQLSGNKIKVYIISDRTLDLQKAHNYICEQLAKDYPELKPSAIILHQTNVVDRTLAGKERVIISSNGYST